MLTIVWISTSRMRLRNNGRTYGLMKDAAVMISQAQLQHGADISSWSTSMLQSEIEHGKAGMTLRKK